MIILWVWAIILLGVVSFAIGLVLEQFFRDFIRLYKEQTREIKK